MYMLLRNQKNVLTNAIKKAGGERRLAEILDISKSPIYYYKLKNRPIREDIFQKLMIFLNLEESDANRIVSKSLEVNWKQILGGRRCYAEKIRTGSFKRNLIKMNTASRASHRRMKREMGKRYYLEQYNRFKTIGIYKIRTERGETVRNLLEERVANLLFHLGVNYQYEPCLRINNKVFFPDFLVRNIIIECTMWRGFDKAARLREKISNYEKRKYKAFVVVPDKLRKFYKSIQYNLIEEKSIGNMFALGSPRNKS